MLNDHQLLLESFLHGDHDARPAEASATIGFALSDLFFWRLMSPFPGCHSAPKLPDKSSKEYGDVVSAFYVGLAALQVGDDVHADSRLSEVTRLVPGEPAGWANWGILALRQRNYDTAAQRLEGARSGPAKRSHL